MYHNKGLLWMNNIQNVAALTDNNHWMQATLSYTLPKISCMQHDFGELTSCGHATKIEILYNIYMIVRVLKHTSINYLCEWQSTHQEISFYQFGLPLLVCHVH